MGSDHHKANCRRCDRIFEYTLFSKSYPYCPDCKDELDAASLRAIGEGKSTFIEDRMSGMSSSKSPMQRQDEYTAEDHLVNMRKPKSGG